MQTEISRPAERAAESSKTRNQEDLAEGDARTSNAGEDSQAKAVKHPRTDTRTTNVSADHLGKWSKVDNQRTNAQVVAGLVRLDLITPACPNRKLGNKDVTCERQKAGTSLRVQCKLPS
jgi:hypothetical protein